MTMNDVTSPSVDEVKTCANGPEGNQMFKMYGDDVASLDPPHKFVPWIMFNDVSGFTFDRSQGFSILSCIT